MRGERPFVMTNLRAGDGIDVVADFIIAQGLLRA
jgi:urease accessory protein